MHQKVAAGGFASDTAWLTRGLELAQYYSPTCSSIPGLKRNGGGQRAHKRSRCRFLRSCFWVALDVGGFGEGHQACYEFRAILRDTESGSNSEDGEDGDIWS
jgi:hypothetical protein